jgi:hypothetical protein
MFCCPKGLISSEYRTGEVYGWRCGSSDRALVSSKKSDNKNKVNMKWSQLLSSTKIESSLVS